MSIAVAPRMKVAVLALLVAGCAGRQTMWTTLEPPEIPDGAEAFMLVGDRALHVANVVEADGILRAHVRHAWQLPPAGVAAIADASTISPSDIARRAAWPRIDVPRSLVIPTASVRSARVVVEVEDESEAGASHHDAVIGVFDAVATIVDVAVCGPCPCRR